jgi:hypothetical protein
MDSIFLSIEVELELWPGIIECVDARIPSAIQAYLEYHAMQEVGMQESTIKKIEFEVEVEYRTHGGKRIPVTATCHTVCPNFVKAWVEKEAMREFQGHEELMTHVTNETQLLRRTA